MILWYLHHPWVSAFPALDGTEADSAALAAAEGPSPLDGMPTSVSIKAPRMEDSGDGAGMGSGDNAGRGSGEQAKRRGSHAWSESMDGSNCAPGAGGSGSGSGSGVGSDRVLGSGHWDMVVQ